MYLYFICRLSAWANLAELEAADVKSAKFGNEEMPDRVRRMRSYIVMEANGWLGSFSVYRAKDPELFREHARGVGR
ncbi:DUF4242 domain-containing protein [Hyphomicrobium sp.]|jgi:predicted NUDIX family NTP pyrophosphohydrolase|uniref:DUF4242 domain-containing protein n=1 Tax=Hyphomicrobium sp. TaxID=82 RepID=UPI0035616C5B